MAFNPPLDARGQPERINGDERMLLQRTGMLLECTSPDNRQWHSIQGEIFLSNLRIVFIAADAHGAFQAPPLP